MRRATGMALLAALCLGSALGAQPAEDMRTPAEHRRGEEQTFLTFPEWFLVFSPREYASLVTSEPPSHFPFLAHVRQLWSGYAAVHRATRDRYPVNAEYHVMVWVIGLSTTLEYGLRAAYETLIGRLTELTGDYPETDEDRLAARIADDYARFLDGQPWFEFDFAAALGELWRLPAWGPSPLRKWERRYALTSEYAAKALYGWLIGRATRSSFETPSPLTLAIVEGLPERTANLTGLRVRERAADGSALVELPRYQPFTEAAVGLAIRGIGFREIAGNRDAIVISALVPPGASPATPGARVLARQPILTTGESERVLVELPVAELDEALRELSAPPAVVEHVYDY